MIDQMIDNSDGAKITLCCYLILSDVFQKIREPNTTMPHFTSFSLIAACWHSPSAPQNGLCINLLVFRVSLAEGQARADPGARTPTQV